MRSRKWLAIPNLHSQAINAARADVCCKMARVAISPAHRTMLEHMAETWIRIAQDVQSDREATENGGGRK